jgi:hypothetical protein
MPSGASWVNSPSILELLLELAPLPAAHLPVEVLAQPELALCYFFVRHGATCNC